MAPLTRVILDTDIGLDIDDHWALAMALGCPALELLLVTVCTGDTIDRAELVAAVLTAAGRDDVPIGVGPRTELPAEVPGETMPDPALRVPLDRYRGTIRHDAAKAIVDAVNDSDEPVTIVSIGPVGNIADAVRLDPSIVGRARLIAMAGNLWGGAFGLPAGPQPEHNVGMDPTSFQALLDTDLDITLAPFDIAAQIRIDGEDYRALAGHASPVIDLVLAGYRGWMSELAVQGIDRGEIDRDVDPATGTTALFDALPVYLAVHDSAVTLQSLRVGVVAEETLGEMPHGRSVTVVTGWRDRDAFDRFLIGALRRAGGTHD